MKKFKVSLSILALVLAIATTAFTTQTSANLQQFTYFALDGEQEIPVTTEILNEYGGSVSSWADENCVDNEPICLVIYRDDVPFDEVPGLYSPQN